MIIVQMLLTAFAMFWGVLWPLILGFALSGIVQTMVSHKKLSQALGGQSPRHLTLATLFGMSSSACSYAAVALARSLFQKGASFTAAMVFEIASTNLVIELGIILFVLLGWQFLAAELVGGILMIIFLSCLFRFTLTPKLVSLAKQHAVKGLLGKMEGHAAMDMNNKNIQSQNANLKIQGELTAISHIFVMDIVAIWVDIFLGFIIAGALAVFIPQSFWQTLFFTHNSIAAAIEGPLIGPLIAIISFVCSIGNVPLAAVLWHGGMSFGGVMSFIFADLIILPLLDIYRKYYGWKVMSYILVTFYITMVLAGYAIECLFDIFHLIPINRSVYLLSQGLHWNYTSWLNIIFLIIASLLLLRFFRTGGISMLRMMEESSQEMHHHEHMHH